MLKKISSFDQNSYEKIKGVFSSESNVYYDEKYFYKIYKNLNNFELQRKELKINMLDGYSLENVVLPEGKIYCNRKFKGLFSNYIKNSYPLYDFKHVNKNAKDFFNIIKNSSFTLRNIHEHEIIVSDLNFDNIIFDTKGNHYFIDFDSCKLNNVPNDRISMVAHNYIKYRMCDYEVDYNFDRLSMLLSTFLTIFEKEIQNISDFEYDVLSEKIKTLKNLRSIFIKLKKRMDDIPEIPYIDEFIENEEYTFTRL